MRILVIPKPGLSLRDPVTREILPAEGSVKIDGQYWRRRERDGDVTIAPAPAQDD